MGKPYWKQILPVQERDGVSWSQAACISPSDYDFHKVPVYTVEKQDLTLEYSKFCILLL